MDEWIPAFKEVPNPRYTVLVTFYKWDGDEVVPCIGVGAHDGEEWCIYNDDYDEEHSIVLAWMIAPDPYSVEVLKMKDYFYKEREKNK